jgi:undecaprenyl-diphosphatase
VTHLTYLEAAVVGLVQGVSEMFPVSSLGHNVLIPALVGGSWASDLNVAAPESPYLAFIVGLHVATAIALLIYFRRDWIRIIGGFLTSVRYRQVRTEDQRLAWMIILATIPVGLAGLAFEHPFRVIFGKPVIAGVFLAVNGLILLAGEGYRSRASLAADAALAAQRERARREPARREPGQREPGQREAVPYDPVQVRAGEPQLVAAGRAPAGAHARHGGRILAEPEQAGAVQADRRLAAMGYPRAILIGSAQILALLAGISRDGVTMVAGMARGLSREDAARFAFLLATPVILAAGALKIPDLFGPLGSGIRGQILLGSVLSGVGAYLSVRFLLRFLRTRTLTPFGVYCLIAGLASVAFLGLVR